MTAQEYQAQLEPLRQRITTLNERRDALAAERARLTAERAQYVAAGAPPEDVAAHSARLGTLDTELAPIADAIAHLQGKVVSLEPGFEAARREEAIATLRAEHARTAAEAIAARTALREAIRTFVLETAPPLIAANQAAQEVGRAVQTALNKETTGGDNASGWGVEVYGEATLAQAVHAIEVFALQFKQ